MSGTPRVETCGGGDSLPQTTPPSLQGFEKLSVPLMDAINSRPRVKNGLQRTVGLANAVWMRHVAQRVWRIDGAEVLDELDAPHGMVLAANHRSFFDLYVCSAFLIDRHPHLIRRIYCPVRSTFFYERPLGAVVNMALSGGSMWPPIFRDDRGPARNVAALEALAAQMGPGSFVGLHPEGRRSKADPYELLPAKPGLGLLLRACHPDTVVMPYFTLGLPNSLLALIAQGRKPVGQRGMAASLRFGTPLRAGDVIAGRTPLEATELVMDRIRELGRADETMRREGGGQA